MVVRNPYLPFFFCLTLMFFCIAPTYAMEEDDTIDLGNFPEKLAEAFNIDTFAGGILASSIFMVAFILPTAIFARRGNYLPSLFVGMLILGFCIAVGWLHYFFIVIVALLVALMFSGRMRVYLSGGR